MKKTQLWDAERLARFSNAVVPSEAEAFRRLNRDFLPPLFWTQTTPYAPGDAVFEGDTDMRSMLGILGIDRPKTVPYWWKFQQAVRAAWEDGFPIESSLVLISIGDGEFRPLGKIGPPRVLPYQHAVMLLAIESWRARFCGQCGNRFVADKPARRFCSSRCSAKAREASRAASWTKHGKQWRNRYQRRDRIRKSGKKQERPTVQQRTARRA